jgi:hypothetical protein
VPDAIAGNVTVRETQAFANEVASQLGTGGVLGAGVSGAMKGTIYAHGRHLIIGIPAVPEVLIEK